MEKREQAEGEIATPLAAARLDTYGRWISLRLGGAHFQEAKVFQRLALSCPAQPGSCARLTFQCFSLM